MSEQFAQAPIFVYGTLCIAEVRRTLLRRSVVATAAVLKSAEVRRVHGRTYPTLLLGRVGHSVEGMVLEGLTAPERDVLRGFEPQTYELLSVDVYNASRFLTCMTFVHLGGLAVTAEPWTSAGFTGAAYDRFLAQVSHAAEVLWEGGEFDLDAPPESS